MTDHSSTVKKTIVKYSRVKRKILSHVLFVRIFIILFLLVIVVGIGFSLAYAIKRFNIPLAFRLSSNFVNAPTDRLAQDGGRTNVLVMGKAGGAHDGPDLTDTIMLVSFGLEKSDVKIFSIPRDVWIPDIRAKVNSAYYWGIQKEVGGINFAKAEISQIVGVPIHYGTVIDFSGFKEIVDELGGIEVEVEREFTDYLYPISGRENDDCGGRDPELKCRYETLTFKSGTQAMNGETALKFVRSRHAEGLEGTDLARNARQAKVIEAIKNRLTDKNLYLNYKKINSLVKVVLRSIKTDIEYTEAAILARRAYDSRDSINSLLIPEELLVEVKSSPAYDKQTVFIPRAGNGKWEEINRWVGSVLN